MTIAIIDKPGASRDRHGDRVEKLRVPTRSERRRAEGHLCGDRRKGIETCTSGHRKGEEG